MKLAIQTISKKLVSLLTKYGVEMRDALIVIEVLLEGNLRGYHNHGIERIFEILEGLRQGSLQARPIIKIIKDRCSIQVIDGGNGLGHPIGKTAMETAIYKAKKTGIGLVGALNSSHLGVLSYYSELASQQECIGLVMSTSSPAVVLEGSDIKTFGTNPISYSLPYSAYPITADFATAKVARGTIYEYAQKGWNIPLGWGVDAQGNDTSNPKEVLNGGGIFHDFCN